MFGLLLTDAISNYSNSRINQPDRKGISRCTPTTVCGLSKQERLYFDCDADELVSDAGAASFYVGKGNRVLALPKRRLLPVSSFQQWDEPPNNADK